MTNKYIRRATVIGKRSMSVVLPADIVRELGITKYQELVVKRRGKKIIIKQAR